MRRLPEALLQATRKSHLLVRGQAIVEFALLMPILLFMSLGFIELQFFFSAQHTVQIKADALAKIAAERIEILPGESWNAKWNTLVNSETSGTRCATTPTVTAQFPDTTKKSGDRVKITWSCLYSPIVQGIPGLPELGITVQSVAVIDQPTPTPTPSPSPSAS